MAIFQYNRCREAAERRNRMERLPDITAEQLIAATHERYLKLMADIAAAMNKARPGHMIDDPDREVNDLCKQFQSWLFETAGQTKTDAAEAAFSPGGPRDGQASAIEGAPKDGFWHAQRAY